MALRYEGPLIAWTAEQWHYRFRGSQTAIINLPTKQVDLKQRLFLNYGTLKLNINTRFHQMQERVRKTLTFRRRATLGQKKTRPKAHTYSVSEHSLATGSYDCHASGYIRNMCSH